MQTLRVRSCPFWEGGSIRRESWRVNGLAALRGPGDPLAVLYRPLAEDRLHRGLEVPAGVGAELSGVGLQRDREAARTAELEVERHPPLVLAQRRPELLDRVVGQPGGHQRDGDTGGPALACLLQ